LKIIQNNTLFAIVVLQKKLCKVQTSRWKNEFNEYTVHENILLFSITFFRSHKKALQFRCDILVRK